MGLRVVGLWGHGMSGTVPFGAAVLGAIGVPLWGFGVCGVGLWDVGGVQSEKNTKNQKLTFDPLNQFLEIDIIQPKLN